MEPCSFCGKQIPFGTGKMYVKKDGKILYFCSRRCEKNLLQLKRNPRNFGFTEAARFTKKQRMAAQEHKEAAPAEAPPAKAPAKKAVKKAAKKAPSKAAE